MAKMKEIKEKLKNKRKSDKSVDEQSAFLDKDNIQNDAGHLSSTHLSPGISPKKNLLWSLTQK